MGCSKSMVKIRCRMILRWYTYALTAFMAEVYRYGPFKRDGTAVGTALVLSRHFSQTQKCPILNRDVPSVNFIREFQAFHLSHSEHLTPRSTKIIRDFLLSPKRESCNNDPIFSQLSRNLTVSRCSVTVYQEYTWHD